MIVSVIYENALLFCSFVVGTGNFVCFWRMRGRLGLSPVIPDPYPHRLGITWVPLLLLCSIVRWPWLWRYFMMEVLRFGAHGMGSYYLLFLNLVIHFKGFGPNRKVQHWKSAIYWMLKGNLVGKKC